MRPQSLFCIGKFFIYLFSRSDYVCIDMVCISYNVVCIDMVVHLITVCLFLFLCMLYNIIVVYTSSWYFVLSLSSDWFIPPLHHCYICVFINMFVNVTYMVTEICLCTSCDMLLSCATYWESFHAYFLYIILYENLVILVELHSQ